MWKLALSLMRTITKTFRQGERELPDKGWVAIRLLGYDQGHSEDLDAAECDEFLYIPIVYWSPLQVVIRETTWDHEFDELGHAHLLATHVYCNTYQYGHKYLMPSVKRYVTQCWRVHDSRRPLVDLDLHDVEVESITWAPRFDFWPDGKPRRGHGPAGWEDALNEVEGGSSDDEPVDEDASDGEDEAFPAVSVEGGVDAGIPSVVFIV